MERSIQPTRPLPMKLKNATRGSLTSLLATSLPLVRSACPHSSGSPASLRIDTTRMHESGVASAGFTMKGHPAATAGQT